MKNKIIKLALVLLLGLALFLRFWKIDKVPVSLFGDELDVGYHAYSILKTGRDYYGNFMPLHFHSIAEWRTPLYLYSAVPSVALFGISPLGVRLPAVIFGVLSILGLYLLVFELLKYGLSKEISKISNNNFSKLVAIISVFIITINPWHIQYSRAAFEVTELLFFLIFGLYFFFRSLKDDGKHLWISVLLLTFTPWIYSTAKLFTPILLFYLFLVWSKLILNFPHKEKIKAVAIGLIVGLPIAYSTFFGGGTQRAGHVSIFTDPTIVPEVGTSRLKDALVRGSVVLGFKPSFSDKFFHNKVTFWTEKITSNYLEALSSDFLFVNGDPNLRHSIKGMGQFYKIEFLLLILGLILFFKDKIDIKIKSFILFWIMFGILPAAITRDGGNHATRLIIILPPLIIFMAYGFIRFITILKSNMRYLFIIFYSLILTISFVFYQHNFWIHNPWDSERWWHSGYKESIQTIKEIDKDYSRVIISMAGEPAWIFFAGWYMYPPDLWQKEFPIGNDEYIKGFGYISHTGKFYFGTFNQEGESLYDLSRYIDEKTIYMAVAKEIGANLVMEPERTPPGLKLIKAILYPSGEPAFYLFTKNI